MAVPPSFLKLFCHIPKTKQKTQRITDLNEVTVLWPFGRLFHDPGGQHKWQAGGNRSLFWGTTNQFLEEVWRNVSGYVGLQSFSDCSCSSSVVVILRGKCGAQEALVLLGPSSKKTLSVIKCNLHLDSKKWCKNVNSSSSSINRDYHLLLPSDFETSKYQSPQLLSCLFFCCSLQ